MIHGLMQSYHHHALRYIDMYIPQYNGFNLALYNIAHCSLMVSVTATIENIFISCIYLSNTMLIRSEIEPLK